VTDGGGGASSFVSGGGRPAIPPGLQMLFNRYQGNDNVPQGLQNVFGRYDFTRAAPTVATQTPALTQAALTPTPPLASPLASAPVPGQPNFAGRGLPQALGGPGGLPAQAGVPDWVRAFLANYLPGTTI